MQTKDDELTIPRQLKCRFWKNCINRNFDSIQKILFAKISILKQDGEGFVIFKSISLKKVDPDENVIKFKHGKQFGNKISFGASGGSSTGLF